MLRLDKVSAAYGAVTALRDADITVAAGEIVALIGSNGAGKSTTLKTISGLVRPSAGTIEFQGEDITGLSPEDIVARGIIQVPEGRRVFPRLTVQQNLAAGAYSPRAHGKEKSTRERVFALFPRLYERRRQLAGSLSGGEQQMLAFGRAMMAQPVLLLLDEPSLGLAPIVIEEVAKAIEHFRADGVTVLLVEQNAELALDARDAWLCDRDRQHRARRIRARAYCKIRKSGRAISARRIGKFESRQQIPDAHPAAS